MRFNSCILQHNKYRIPFTYIGALQPLNNRPTTVPFSFYVNANDPMRRVENSCRIKQIYKTRLNWFCSCVRLCMPFGSHLAIHIDDALEKKPFVLHRLAIWQHRGHFNTVLQREKNVCGSWDRSNAFCDFNLLQQIYFALYLIHSLPLFHSCSRLYSYDSFFFSPTVPFTIPRRRCSLFMLLHNKI